MSEFAARTSFDQVRLATPAEQWPDGYARVGNDVQNIEITEVIEPGRRRGDEYKTNETDISDDPVEDWVVRAEAIPDALEKAIIAKVEKKYGSSATLLVYLNMDEYGIRQSQIEGSIAAIKARHASAFDKVIVLWKERLL